MTDKTRSGQLGPIPLDPIEGDLLGADPFDVASVLTKLDWDFAEECQDGSAHALHPYPAKFVAPLPHRLIHLLSTPGELVLDPFSGGGTTGVEALALGRLYVGIDANRVGNLVAQAKMTALSKESGIQLQHLEAELLQLSADDLVNGEPRWLPAIPNLEKWYDAAAFRALGLVRDLA
ncbi:MAG: DNA methyltransferase, partial [Gaiellaceae bacterium]